MWLSDSLTSSDHIAIPDMGWAMENWGLITYGEELLCVDNEASGANAIVSAATVIGHEVSHQVNNISLLSTESKFFFTCDVFPNWTFY
jgi:hypothetical protein